MRKYKLIIVYDFQKCNNLKNQILMEERKEIHYGYKVKEKLEERGMTVAEFARRIPCARNNVYNIFERQYIDMKLLQRISDILDFDFIREAYES